MPYELSFTKVVGIQDREQYINECCVGGDVVRDELLPLVRARYEDVQTEQEDWGWFIWFRSGPVRLAIDIFTDDPDTGTFRIHLTARVKRFVAFERVRPRARRAQGRRGRTALGLGGRRVVRDDSC